MPMALVIFDLDNTLIAGDSDYLWGEFLVRHHHVDGELYRRENERFYSEYAEGRLNIEEWLEFQFRPLAANPATVLEQWREKFIAEDILPIMLPQAAELIESHRQAGDTLLIITATNRFITEPISVLLEIPHLIATNPQVVDGEYTGAVEGIASYQEGKITRLNEWLREHKLSMAGSTFYSDSHNDLALLGHVDHPVAVNPDDTLRRVATERGWPILSLRG